MEVPILTTSQKPEGLAIGNLSRRPNEAAATQLGTVHAAMAILASGSVRQATTTLSLAIEYFRGFVV